MSEYYEVKKIEGKGMGCVALKEIKLGTMILQEKPQLKLKSGSWSFQDLMIAFQQMGDNEEEYLNLSNRFENFDDLIQFILCQSDQKKSKSLNKWTKGLKENLAKFNSEHREAILKIIGIYYTNCFDDGVVIKISRLNHSCRSNCEYRWNEKTGFKEVRVVSKIEKGDEITINYAFNHSMQDFQSRHEKWIKPNWGFVCLCDRCEEEKSNLESDKTFCKKFDEIRKKAKKLHNENEINQPIKLEKIMLEVLFYEEMYKMAKEKKTSWSFMIDHILDYAFDAAAQGYISAQKKISDLDKKSDQNSSSVSEEKKKISEQMKKFNGKCESFSTAAEKIAKIVWGKENRNYLEWRDKKNNLGNVHFLRISMRSRMREPYPGDP